MNTEQERRRHADQWVLVDARLQMLRAGTALYHGVSPRAGLDVTARHVLIPQIRDAVRHGQECTGTDEYGGRHWDYRVIPIHGPVIGTPLAILGCYGPDAAAFPEPPLVGAWEWRITPPGPDQQMRTYWSPELFDVYGIDRPADTSAQHWEGPQWIDELIVETDRPEIRRQLDRFIAATTDGLFLHVYRTNNPATGQTQRLRLAGRSYRGNHSAPSWFRGVSARVDDESEVEAPPGTHDFINAAFRVSRDPLCAIDTTYEHLYMTSQNFGSLEVALPTHRYLPEMVHPDDLEPLRGLLTSAASRPERTVGPARIRFRHASGTGWHALDVVGNGMHLADCDDPHHVLCRVTIADHE